jgi:serine/threonine-protein kinase RsbW
MVSESSIHKVVIPGLPSRLEQVCDAVLSQASENNYTEDEIFAIHLAIQEAFANALKHGNCDDPEKTITVEYSITPKRVDISVTDQGSGFKPEEVPDPRCDENIYKTFGRGVLMMRSYMDKVEYNDPGNSVHMVKFRKMK